MRFLGWMTFAFLVGVGQGLAAQPQCPFQGLAPLPGAERLVYQATSATETKAEQMERNAHRLSVDLVDNLEAHAERLNLDVDAVFPAVMKAAWVAKELRKNAALWGNRLEADKRLALSVTVDGKKIRVIAQDQSSTPFQPATDPFRRQPGETEAQMRLRKSQAGRDPGGSEGLFYQLLEQHGLSTRYVYLRGNRVAIDIPWTYDGPR